MQLVNSETLLNKCTYLSLVALSLFVFTSFSLTALSHLLIIIPGFYFLFLALKEKDMAMSLEMKVFGFLTLWSILSIFANWNDLENPLKFLLKTKYMLLGFVSIFAYRKLVPNFLNDKKIRFLIYAILISTSVATLHGFVAVFTGWNLIKWKPVLYETRVSGMYGMLISYAYGICLIASLMGGLVFFKERMQLKLNSQLLWFCFIFNSLAVIATQTRGAMLGFACAIFLLILFKSKKWALIFLFFLIAVLGLLSQAKLNNWQGARLFEKIEKNSSYRRIGLFQAAFYAGVENPLLGLGYRNFENHSVHLKKKYQVKQLPAWRGHAHNNILEMLAGTGFVGGILYISWLLIWFVRSLKGSYYQKIFSPFILCFLVSGLFQSSFIDGENSFLIMAIFGLSQISFQPESI